MKNEKSQFNQEMQRAYSRSYILRLWREDQSHNTGFRASLEDPHTGERFGFASLEQLFAYLMDMSEGNGSAD